MSRVLTTVMPRARAETRSSDSRSVQGQWASSSTPAPRARSVCPGPCPARPGRIAARNGDHRSRRDDERSIEVRGLRDVGQGEDVLRRPGQIADRGYTTVEDGPRVGQPEVDVVVDHAGNQEPVPLHLLVRFRRLPRRTGVRDPGSLHHDRGGSDDLARANPRTQPSHQTSTGPHRERRIPGTMQLVTGLRRAPPGAGRKGPFVHSPPRARAKTPGSPPPPPPPPPPRPSPS